MTQIARHVRVVGRVQGVWFRAWTAEQANELGVVGWVRNAADGSVEAHLEGDDGAVAKLIKRLHDGPPSARVARVDADIVDPKGAEGFEVRH